MSPKAKTAIVLLGALGVGALAFFMTRDAKADEAAPQPQPEPGPAPTPGNVDTDDEPVTVEHPDGTVTEVPSSAVTDAAPPVTAPPVTTPPVVQHPSMPPVVTAPPVTTPPSNANQSVPPANASSVPNQSTPSTGPTDDLPALVADCKAKGGTFDLATRQCILPGGGILTSTAPADSGGAPVPTPPTAADQEEHPAVLETAPALDPNGTVALAHLMLAAENESGWKTALGPEIGAWQKATGTLVSDNKFGPKSAYRMAEEVGVLPYIRFWPLGKEWGSGNKSFALAKYRKELNAIADRLAKDPKMAPQAAAIRASALRENLQGWPDKPAAQPKSLSEVQGIVDRLGAEAADKAVSGLVSKIS